MYSTSTLVASVTIATFAGSVLGLVLGVHHVPICVKNRSHYGLLRYVTCQLCHQNARRFPKRLILVRHGESEGNIDPLLYGRIPDNAMHLTELGYEQAIAAGEAIKKIVAKETMRFIVSPYVRTIETFNGICKAWGIEGATIPWTEEPRIREQDFGNFQEPMKIRECKAQRRRFGSFFYRFPSGESPADVYDRVSSFLESLYRMFDKSLEENYVLVTHGVAIRVILMRYFKYRISDFELLENFRNGEFVVLEFNECQGKFVLKTIVSNNVHFQEDGSIVVDTEERTQLRRHSSDTMSFISKPYATSPINHFRHPPSPSPSISSTASSPRNEDTDMVTTSFTCFSINKSHS